jgi:hypothetical protein
MPQYIIQYDQGTAPGPFNVFLSGSSGLTLYASNVTKSQLQTGLIITFADGIPSSSVIIDNIAYGCSNEEQLIFPTPTPTITPSVTITPSITATPSITPTRTPTITPTRTITPSITATPSITPTFTPTNTPTTTINATPTATPSATPTRTPSTTPPPTNRTYYFTAGNTTWEDNTYTGLRIGALIQSNISCGIESNFPSFGSAFTPTTSTISIPNWDVDLGCVYNYVGGNAIIPYQYLSNDLYCLFYASVSQGGLYLGLGNNNGGGFSMTPGNYNITITNTSTPSNTITTDITLFWDDITLPYNLTGVAEVAPFDFTLGDTYLLTINSQP